jgi:hypothetical protein
VRLDHLRFAQFGSTDGRRDSGCGCASDPAALGPVAGQIAEPTEGGDFDPGAAHRMTRVAARVREPVLDLCVLGDKIAPGVSGLLTDPSGRGNAIAAEALAADGG